MLPEFWHFSKFFQIKIDFITKLLFSSLLEKVKSRLRFSRIADKKNFIELKMK